MSTRPAGSARSPGLTVGGRAPDPLLAGPEDGLRARTSSVDAVTLLTWYLLLLMAIPSSLVVGALGAAGTPAGLLAALLFAWYVVARQHPALEIDRGPQPIRVAAILFGCSFLASYVSANRAAMPVLQENGADRGLIMLSGWLGILLLAADGIGAMDRLATLIRRVVLGTTAMAMLGMVEFFTGQDLAQSITIPGLSMQPQVTDLMSRDNLVRVIATAAQPIEFATVLAMSLPLAIHQARFAPAAQRKRRWAQVALIAVAALMTVSRTAILGLAVVCIVLVPTWPRRDRWRAYLVLVAVPGLISLAKPSVLSSVGKLFGAIGSDQSTRSRTAAYSEAVPYIAHHPWFGQGFGTFFPQTYFFVDNQYLTSLIETGFIGALALVTLFLTGWLTARSVRRTAADLPTRDLAQSLAASVAVAAVCFATFDALSFSIASGLCFLLLGSIGAVARLVRRPRGQNVI